MDYKMHQSARQYMAQKQAEDNRVFGIYLIGLVGGLALIFPALGVIWLSEHVITTGLLHTVLQIMGKTTDIMGLVLMFGCLGWAVVLDN